jgi:stearoyl-CoA desaturase (delta-9 desaturase)
MADVEAVAIADAPRETITDVPRARYVENAIKTRGVLFGVHIVAVAFAWQTLHLDTVILAVTLAIITTIGVEIGFHRHIIHQAFDTKLFIRYALAVAGTLAAQDGPISWAANHRKHHKYSDEVGLDPHTPVKSFWYGHMLWFYRNTGLLKSRAYYEKWTPDLLREPVLVFIDKRDNEIMGLSVLLLYLAGGFPYVVWGFAVRTVVVWHFEFMVNSVCHRFGKSPHKTGDQSKNVWWLAIPTLGESYHNNHHFAPRSAHVGFMPGQFDLGWMLIRSMEKLGLAWNVVRPPKSVRVETQAQQA